MTLADNLAPTTLRNITLGDGSSDRFTVTHDVNAYQGITDMSERLILNFAGSSSFLTGVGSLLSSLNASGTGLGAFSLLYADDCQNYACGPVLPYFAGAEFTFSQPTASSISSVPVPAALWLFCSSLFGLRAKMLPAWMTRNHADTIPGAMHALRGEQRGVERPLCDVLYHPPYRAAGFLARSPASRPGTPQRTPQVRRA